jgi:hypothetical protein
MTGERLAIWGCAYAAVVPGRLRGGVWTSDVIAKHLRVLWVVAVSWHESRRRGGGRRSAGAAVLVLDRRGESSRRVTKALMSGRDIEQRRPRGDILELADRRHRTRAIDP